MTTVTRGYSISQLLAFTAFPFAVGSQAPKKGVRAYAWDDIIINPQLSIPLILAPIIAVMITMKGVQ